MAAPRFDSGAGPAMYTNALLGTAMDERHIWYTEQQERLEQDRDADVAALCGDARAIHEAGQPEKQPLHLAPIRSYNVETLAEFLANPGVCQRCRVKVVEDTGFDWDDYDGEFTFKEAHTLEEPDEVAAQYHAEQAGQMYDERYDGSEQVQEWLEGATGVAALVEVDLEDVQLGEEHAVVPSAGPDRGGRVDAVVVKTGEPTYVDDGEHSHLVAGEYLRREAMNALTDEDREQFDQEYGGLEWQAPQDERTSDAADALRYATAPYSAFVEYGRGDSGDSGPPAPPAPTPLVFDPQQFGVQVDTGLGSVRDAQQAGRQHLGGQIKNATEALRDNSFTVDVAMDEGKVEAIRDALEQVADDAVDRAVRDSPRQP